MNHHASPDFWSLLRSPSQGSQELAAKSFAVLKGNPKHPSLHFKRIDRFWSARVGLHYRAVEAPDGLLWFWVGTHGDYDKIVGTSRSWRLAIPPTPSAKRQQLRKDRVDGNRTACSLYLVAIH